MFRVARCGLVMMLNFSLKHNIQIPVTGLYVGAFSIIFQKIEGVFPSSFFFQTYVDKVVEFRLLSFVGIGKIFFLLTLVTFY